MPVADLTTAVMATRHALLELHRHVLARARIDVERERGRLTSTEFWQLLMTEPALRWLAPMAELIVHMDLWLEATADAATAADATALLNRTRALLLTELHDSEFDRTYAAMREAHPDVMHAHAQVLRALPRP